VISVWAIKDKEAPKNKPSNFLICPIINAPGLRVAYLLDILPRRDKPSRPFYPPLLPRAFSTNFVLGLAFGQLECFWACQPICIIQIMEA